MTKIKVLKSELTSHISTGHKRSHIDGPPESVKRALDSLEEKVKEACLAADISTQLVVALGHARRSLADGNLAATVDAIDRFVLTIQRHLGSEISLRKAFELVDVAIIDIKRFVGEPAQIFAEAVAFGKKFYELELAGETPLLLRARPIPEGIRDTVQSMQQAIRSFRLPEDSESRLLAAVEQMGKLASQFDVTQPSVELNDNFVGVLMQFRAELLTLQGSYITQTQRNHLLGQVVFGVPAWLCASLPAAIVQAILAVGAIIWYFSDPKPVKTALANLAQFVNTFTANTTRRPGQAQIQAALRRETIGLSPEHLAIVKERLRTSRDGASDTAKGILNVMLEEIDSVIEESMN